MEDLAAKQLSAIAEVTQMLDRSAEDYWFLGGWAVDFHVGAVTRAHGGPGLRSVGRWASSRASRRASSRFRS